MTNPKKCERHGIEEDTIRRGIEDSEACIALLKREHQAREVEKKPFTIYSTVYNLSEGSIEHKIEKEGKIHQYNLEDLANGYSNDAFVTLKTQSFRKSRI